MGGAFGGKESQASLIACVAALLAQRTRRPVKLRLDRDDDMVQTARGTGSASTTMWAMTPMAASWHRVHAGGALRVFSDLSRRSATARCSMRQLLLSRQPRIVSHRCKTNTVSNTAFRGFGGPQGMMGIEYVIDEIARDLALIR